MRNKTLLILAFLSVFIPQRALSCTSVIISGKVTSDGRPMMLKHRDSDYPDNAIIRKAGSKYGYIGMINSGNEAEIWSGMNEKGFCIMNTATYDLKDDDVPDSLMDREGFVMAIALGICRTTSDFETLLDTLSRPMGVEANFGVIDAYGGAAYYEVNNHSWVKFDVNEIPCGWRVVTNFTQTGRPSDRHGVDRYDKAVSIMEGLDVSKIGPLDLIDEISRSGLPICRDITTSSIVFHGTSAGADPSRSVMWTCLGWPETVVCIPLMYSLPLPLWMEESGKDNLAIICSKALEIKEETSMEGISGECRKIESYIEPKFSSIYDKLFSGKIGERHFRVSYMKLISRAYRDYNRIFLKYSD